jgi:3-oxoacyl-[acyl-carrier-protein] synthase II
MRHVDSVAVTGLGVITPGGCRVEDYWNVLCDAKSTAQPIDRCARSDVPVSFGCEVRGFESRSRMTAKDARRTDRFAQFALVAALDAYDDAGRPDCEPDRGAVVVGNGGGGAETTQRETRVFLEQGPDQVNPLYVPMVMSNAPPALIAMELGWQGPNFSVATACASGAHAIGEGFRMIRDSSADVVLVGGTEANLTPQALNAFARLQALSTRADEPERASRPFDRERDGFVMGEGAGFCVLERLGAARSRGARVHAVLVGYGRNCDAHHLVMPDPQGAGAARCMRLALADADLAVHDVEHVNAHGTSTRLNDLAEARALHAVFGKGSVPPITSVKGAIGHLIGAAGAVEFVAACRSLAEGHAPPTANYEHPDERLALDVIAGAPRPLASGAVLSNSFGFGGHNASLVAVAA